MVHQLIMWHTLLYDIMACSIDKQIAKINLIEIKSSFPYHFLTCEVTFTKQYKVFLSSPRVLFSLLIVSLKLG